MKRILLLLLLVSCGTNSIEGYQRDAEGVVRALIHEYQQIESKEDLEKREKRLKTLHLKLANLMLKAQDLGEEPPPPSAISDQLREEMCRIYAIEGGRAIVERSQAEALHRLDSVPSGSKRRFKA